MLINKKNIINLKNKNILSLVLFNSEECVKYKKL